MPYFIYFSLNHSLPRGKSGVIEIQTGSEPSIGKNKSGHLLVVSILTMEKSQKSY